MKLHELLVEFVAYHFVFDIKSLMSSQPCTAEDNDIVMKGIYGKKTSLSDQNSTPHLLQSVVC